MVEVDTEEVREPSPGQHKIHETIVASGRPWVLALNKVDKLPDRSRLLPWIQKWQETFDPPRSCRCRRKKATTSRRSERGDDPAPGGAHAL